MNPNVVRMLRRLGVACFRTAELAGLLLGRMPWKVEKFNRLIAADISEAIRAIEKAEVVVGIPFHKETGNIAAVVRTTQKDLETRRQPAAIVIVGERKTRNLLFETELISTSERIKVVRFSKPLGFSQKPGLSRRSWSHWAILQIASRLHADVVFIDADVRNSEGWIKEYLDAIQDRDAAIAVANYVRSFARDDAIVHIWDRLIFGAVFQRWIAFRHGGDYAISRRHVAGILKDPSIMREKTYTMDSAVIARVAQHGGRIEQVWLGTKVHEPINPQSLFRRLPSLVESVFEDVASHLHVLLGARPKSFVAEAGDNPADNRPMKDLIGPSFRQELYSDMVSRFHLLGGAIRRTLGSTAFERYTAGISAGSADKIELSPRDWAKATLRCMLRYLTQDIRIRDRVQPALLAHVYVPILEFGVLGFLNRTYGLPYNEAFLLLRREYLPAFQQTWNSLARRLSVYRMAFFRRWPVRLANRLLGPFRRFIATLPGKT